MRIIKYPLTKKKNAQTERNRNKSKMATNAIIQLNNEAIAKLQTKEFKDAILLFSHAVRSVKQILVQIEEGNISETSSHDVRTSQDQVILQWAHQQLPFDQQDNGSFIYSRPLVFLPPRQSVVPNSCYEQMASGALFNLALSLQLHARTAGAKGVHHLQRSLSVYEKVAEIIPASYSLEPVILHNVGLIHQELFHFEQARLCFELSNIALSTDIAMFTIDEEDRQSMLISTIVFQEPPVAAAA